MSKNYVKTSKRRKSGGERGRKYETFMRSNGRGGKEKEKSRLTMIKSILMEPLKDLLIFENVFWRRRKWRKAMLSKILGNVFSSHLQLNLGFLTFSHTACAEVFESPWLSVVTDIEIDVRRIIYMVSN